MAFSTDDVLLEATERVDASIDRSLGQHAGGLLEAGGLRFNVRKSNESLRTGAWIENGLIFRP